MRILRKTKRINDKTNPIKKLSKVPSIKINMQKIPIIPTNNNSLKKIMDEKTLFSEAMKMINYIGINYIGRNIQNPYINKTVIPERHKRLKSLVLA